MDIVATLGTEKSAIHLTTVKVVEAILPRHAVVVTDENVAAAWPKFARSHKTVVVPPGERSKRIPTYERVLESLAEAGADRSTPVVAWGGGVVGDLAGFAAGTYMRGVPLIQVPTSLLAMVDSSVGGKVGVDLSAGKNLAGAFVAPKDVFVATEFLDTLPEREFRAGMAEVIKYGFIMDASLLDALGGDIRVLVARCIALKVRVVDEDPYETLGRRAILNFGHTVAHAIEQATGYGPVLHGEAVAVGMVVESRLAQDLGIAEAGLVDEVERVLIEHSLPTRLPQGLAPGPLLEAMRRDKKAKAGRLGFSLVSEPGKCTLVPNVPEEAVLRALSSS
jgi:3-dehydroquinate synthase